MKLYTSILFLFFTFISIGLFAQDQVIKLSNPGFEDTPQYAKAPKGWFNCGAPNESPPDIHPIENSEFEVSQTAYEGNTYMGLVVRDNQTVEAVGQRLRTPLQKNKCYEFNVMLCRSKTYKSISKKTGKLVNYNMPVKIRLWAGRDYGDKKEVLSSSSPIQSSTWKEYKFRFQPTQKYDYITIEATYGTANVNFYNGNVLLDNASDIVQISCGDEQPIVATKVEAPKVIKPPVKPKTRPKPPTKKPSPKIASKPKPSSLPKNNLKVGQTISLQRLFFEADKGIVTEDSYETLDELYDFLIKNNKLIIEIGGHTNSTPPDAYCDKLSTERAKFVSNYLQKKGIDANRLTYKGYGKRKPLVSNKTAYGRKRNQRVEVKILKIE